MHHPLTRDDVDLAQLRDELSAKIGRRVELSIIRTDDEEGAVLMVTDPVTAEEVEVSAQTVATAVDEHVPGGTETDEPEQPTPAGRRRASKS